MRSQGQRIFLDTFVDYKSQIKEQSNTINQLNLSNSQLFNSYQTINTQLKALTYKYNDLEFNFMI